MLGNLPNKSGLYIVQPCTCCTVNSELLYIIRYLLVKYRLIFLRVLKVFDEPLGESNTEGE